MSCWDCLHIIRGGERFVQDFECYHPCRREDDIRPIRLDLDDLYDGCEFYEPINEE